MKKITLPILFSLFVFLLILASKEPKPGIHSWFTELAGDWSLGISCSGYEIGNSLEYDKKYVLFQQTKSENSNQYLLKTIADGIDRVSFNDEWILAQMDHEWELYSDNKNEKITDVHPKGWFWLNLYTRDMDWSLNEDDFKAKAPEDVQLLKATLKKLHKSNRNGYLFLSGLLFLIILYRICKTIAERLKGQTNSFVIYQKHQTGESSDLLGR